MNWHRPMASFKCVFLGHRWGKTFGHLSSLGIVFIQCDRCGDVRKV